MVVSKGYSLGVSHRDCVRSKVYSDGASHRDSVVSKSTGVYRDSDTERLVSSSSDEDDDRKIFRIIQQVKNQCVQYGESNLIDCKEWEEVYAGLSKIDLGFHSEVSHGLKTLASLVENVHRIIQQYTADRENMENLISHVVDFSGQSLNLRDKISNTNSTSTSKGENNVDISKLSSLAGNDPRDDNTKPSSIINPNRQWYRLSKSINSFVYGKNAFTENGDGLSCKVCCSTYHLARDCPEQKYHKVYLPCASFTNSDIQCTAMVSNVASHTVCSWEWLLNYLESLSPSDKELVSTTINPVTVCMILAKLEVIYSLRQP